MKHHVILKNEVYKNQKMATSGGILEVDAEGRCLVEDKEVVAAMKASGWTIEELAPEDKKSLKLKPAAPVDEEEELEQSGEATDFDAQEEVVDESSEAVADEGKADKKKNRFKKK